MPKCLRVESRCPAPFDEFGLLCKQCGLCTIQELQEEAERLGYAVLVAEGSAIVMSLIQTGKIDAMVGVSCISVLERAFPYMEAAAIPGIATGAILALSRASGEARRASSGGISIANSRNSSWPSRGFSSSCGVSAFGVRSRGC